ncbi:hypothetical protein MPSEU_000856500 [Mayamaea pseudoterrestris]|nr:hypothetical protein MPSEU_000856500 [Mayamaea pseudoterrestris]
MITCTSSSKLDSSYIYMFDCTDDTVTIDMNDYADNDMQFTPPSIVHKRRAAHQENNDGNNQLDDDSNHSFVWQQAFKRLRVNEQNYQVSSNSIYSGHAQQQAWPQHLPYNEYLSSNSISNQLYSTPPPKQPAQQPPPQTDYKMNNLTLGQLHRERRLREQEELRQRMILTSGDQVAAAGSSNSSYYTEDDDSAMTEDSPGKQPAVHLFGTPLLMRRRNAIKLPTDSKLE